MDRRIILEISLFFYTENRKRNFLSYSFLFSFYFIFLSFCNNVSRVGSLVSKVMVQGSR